MSIFELLQTLDYKKSGEPIAGRDLIKIKDMLVNLDIFSECGNDFHIMEAPNIEIVEDDGNTRPIYSSAFHIDEKYKVLKGAYIYSFLISNLGLEKHVTIRMYDPNK